MMRGLNVICPTGWFVYHVCGDENALCEPMNPCRRTVMAVWPIFGAHPMVTSFVCGTAIENVINALFFYRSAFIDVPSSGMTASHSSQGFVNFKFEEYMYKK